MSEGYLDLFPYEPRAGQEEIMSSIRSCLNEKEHLIYQAATGSGKTICTLTPVLDFADREGKKVLYLTRTNSQQKQVIYEMRQIGGFYGVGLQGRHNTCLLAQDDEELKKGTAEELSKYCSDRKKEVREALEQDREPTSCPYYAGLMKADVDEIKGWTQEEVPTVDGFLDYCSEKGLCAYELAKALLPDADLVVAPYIYFFFPFIRKNLLEWMNVDLEDLIVIVDEAHNLPDYARDLNSVELSNITLERAITESHEFGDPSLEVGKELSSSELCETLRGILLDIADEYVTDEDGLIPPNVLKTDLLEHLQINTNQVKDIIKELKIQAELVQEERRQHRELPRSFINALADFLKSWLNLHRAEFIKLVNGGDNPSIEGYCLDPSDATEILNRCHSTIHQSATLEPLDEYRDSLGLPSEAETRIFPDPFPEENLGLFYTKEMTTKYEVLEREDDMLKKIRDTLDGIIESIDRNTIIFFPSYRLMNEIAGPLMDRREVVVEQQGMTQPQLMDMIADFKNNGGTLFSVIGGRVSEGMDFPGKELEVAIVVGVPYPKPTARQKGLQHYYDMKFGKGWEYTVKAPAVRKILQATGRIVRSENDVGAALILDERAMHFKAYLSDLDLVEEPTSSVKEFFER